MYSSLEPAILQSASHLQSLISCHVSDRFSRPSASPSPSCEHSKNQVGTIPYQGIYTCEPILGGDAGCFNMGMPSKRPFGDLQEDEGLRLKKKTLLSSTPCGNSGQEEQIDEQDRTDVIFKPCKPPCQPLGNLLLAQNGRAGNARDRGLGSLAVLPDELLVGIFSDLEAMDLVRMQAVSHAMYAFTRVEGKWKHEFILKNSGVLDRWRGSWRQTYLHRFCPRLVSLDRLPTDALEICDVYSDVLSAPYLAARYDPGKLVRSSKFADNIPRIDGSKLKAGDLGSEPMILSRLMDDWPAFMGGSQAAWSLETIANRYPNVPFRAEAVLTQLSDYIAYHNHCQHDESPLYIFDADFVEKTEAYEPGHGLLHDFNVPKIFQDDLFSVLGKQRPNYRWLVSTNLSALPCFA